MVSKIALSVGTIAGSLVSLALFALPAHAQATRTWVSGVGDDANPCSRTAPCKTFPGAISKTATGGEINCLDPGGFGGVTINKSIQIICKVEAGVLVSGTNAIIVNAPANAEVLLEGLDIEGLGTGLNGVSVLANNRVTIRQSSIRNFTQNGVRVNGPAGAQVLIQDSYIFGNNNGVDVTGVAGASNTANIFGTLIDNHPGSSVNVAAGSAIIVGNSTLIGSAASVSGAGTFISFGDNRLAGSGNPGTTIPKR